MLTTEPNTLYIIGTDDNGLPVISKSYKVPSGYQAALKICTSLEDAAEKRYASAHDYTLEFERQLGAGVPTWHVLNQIAHRVRTLRNDEHPCHDHADEIAALVAFAKNNEHGY